jgi:glutathione transport system ATP-binding protein
VTETATTPILSIVGLSVEFDGNRVIEDLSFTAEAGKTLAIVGESGSGKSVTSQSIMRLAEDVGAQYPSGHIWFNSDDHGTIDLLKTPLSTMRKIRGKDIAMIFQEPMTSLNPVFTIGDQVCESLTLHKKMSQEQARLEAVELFQMVRLPDATEMLDRYPHQLSGGMRQRVMIAMALACRPKILIADEPTTALDVTIQAQILAILKDLQKELNMALIFITHDMGVVAEVADEVVVMYKGKKVEQGSVKKIFSNPEHPYTQALLSAVPRLGSMIGQQHPKRFPVTIIENNKQKMVGEEHIQDTANYDAKPLLSVRNLVTRFNTRKNFFGKTTHRVHAVEHVSFDIYKGETLALVGESGSGKSTIGRTIQQLQKATSGEISFNGVPFDQLSKSEKKKLRQEIQYIFQDPLASLDPRKTIGFSIAEPIKTHQLIRGEANIQKRVVELLERVGLTREHADRYPHQFSGGQRQRICIARALASNPKLIIADEALSALDVSIQAQIINLFMELQEEHGISYLFISHDMAVVEKISHRVAVLYLGQVVELGTRQQVLEQPSHPYTKRLLSAVPVADPFVTRDFSKIEGEIPSPVRRVGDEPTIFAQREIDPGHFIAQS